MADGVVIEERAAHYGDRVGALPAEWQGRKIAGFYTEQNQEVYAETTVVASIVLYAKFIEKPVDLYEYTDGLLFAYDAESSAYVVEYYFGESTDIKIPARYLGDDGDFPVVAIGIGTFSECHITSIILPEGLLEIRSRAFLMAWGLTKIVLPKSLERIGDSAFVFAEPLDLLVVSSKNLVEIGDSSQDPLILTVPDEYIGMYKDRFEGRSDLIFVLSVKKMVYNTGALWYGYPKR